MMSEYKSSKLNMDYVLEQIENIRKDTDYLYKVVEALNGMSNADVPGDYTGSAKAEALRDVVKCRETTNQQLLSTYTLMFTQLYETGI